MTIPPKEKAKELFDYYDELLFNIINKDIIKKCAIKAADEIISQWEYIDTYLGNGQGNLNPNLEYFYEVKTEIENYDNKHSK